MSKEDIKLTHSQTYTHLSCLSQLTLASVDEKNNSFDLELKTVFKLNKYILATYQIYILTVDYAEGFTGPLKAAFIKIFAEQALDTFDLFQRYFPNGIRIIYLPEKNMKTVPYEFYTQIFLLNIYLSAKQYIVEKFNNLLTHPKVKKALTELDRDWNLLVLALKKSFENFSCEKDDIKTKIQKLEWLFQDYLNFVLVRLLPLIMKENPVPEQHHIQEISKILTFQAKNIKKNVDEKLEKELYRDIFVFNSDNQFQLIEKHVSLTQSKLTTPFDKGLEFSLPKVAISSDLSANLLPNFKTISHGHYHKDYVKISSVHISFGSPASNQNNNLHDINYQTFLNLQQIMQHIRFKKIQAILSFNNNSLSIDEIFTYSLKISKYITEKIQDAWLLKDKNSINLVSILNKNIDEYNIPTTKVSSLYPTNRIFFFPKFFYIYIPERENPELHSVNKATIEACRIVQYALEECYFSHLPLLEMKNGDPDSLWQRFMIEIFHILKTREPESNCLEKIFIDENYFDCCSQLSRAAKEYLIAYKNKTVKTKLDILLNQFKLIENRFFAKLKTWFSTLSSNLASISEINLPSTVKLFKVLLNLNTQQSISPGLIQAIIIFLLQKPASILPSSYMVGGGSVSSAGIWQIGESFLEHFKEIDPLKLLQIKDAMTLELPSKLQFFLQTPYHTTISSNWAPKFTINTSDELLDLFKRLNKNPTGLSYIMSKKKSDEKVILKSLVSTKTTKIIDLISDNIKKSETFRNVSQEFDSYFNPPKKEDKNFQKFEDNRISLKKTIFRKIYGIKSKNLSLNEWDKMSLAWMELIIKTQPQFDPVFLHHNFQSKLYIFIRLIAPFFPESPNKPLFLKTIEHSVFDAFLQLIYYIFGYRIKSLKKKYPPPRLFFFNNPYDGIYQSIISIIGSPSQYIDSVFDIQIMKFNSYIICPEFFHKFNELLDELKNELTDPENLDSLIFNYTRYDKIKSMSKVTLEDIQQEILRISLKKNPIKKNQSSIEQLDDKQTEDGDEDEEKKAANIKKYWDSTETSKPSEAVKQWIILKTWLNIFIKRLPKSQFISEFQNEKIKFNLIEYLNIVKQILEKLTDFILNIDHIEEFDYMDFLNLTDLVFKYKMYSLNNTPHNLDKNSPFYEDSFDKVYRTIVAIWENDPSSFKSTLTSQIPFLKADLTKTSERELKKSSQSAAITAPGR